MKDNNIQYPQIFKYSFLTVISTPLWASIYQKKYLSILTDGAINPLNNTLEEVLYVELDNGKRILIKGEVHNIPLGNAKKFYFINKFYRCPPTSCADTTEGGHGNLFLIFSEFPLDYELTKNNPTVNIALTIPAVTTNYYWIGIDRPQSSYELLIPYIPSKYNYLIIACQATGGTVAGVQYNPYVGSLQIGGYVQTINDVPHNFLITQRGRVTIQNTHATNSSVVDLHLLFSASGA